jgi:hypothetical protein
MLFDETSDKVRMSRSELATLRQRAARNGFAVNRVQNNSEALDALLKALHPSIAADMLQFLKTGSSAFTACASVEELEQLLSEA